MGSANVGAERRFRPQQVCRMRYILRYSIIPQPFMRAETPFRPYGACHVGLLLIWEAGKGLPFFHLWAVAAPGKTGEKDSDFIVYGQKNLQLFSEQQLVIIACIERILV